MGRHAKRNRPRLSDASVPEMRPSQRGHGDAPKETPFEPPLTGRVTAGRQRAPKWLRRLAHSGPLLFITALLWLTTLGKLWGSAANVTGIDFYDYYTVSHALGHPPVLVGSAIYGAPMQ